MGLVASEFHFIWQGPRSQSIFLPTNEGQEDQDI